MEKIIEEKLQPKEGDDPLDDEAKQLMARKLRFKLMTKGFYAPKKQKKEGKKPKFQAV